MPTNGVNQEKSMCEEWKDIKGYENIYQISNFGNIRRINRWAGNQCKSVYVADVKDVLPYMDDFGYMKVCLSYHNKSKHFRVHRLVAQAFIPNPDKLPQVNHKDEDKTNNRVDNLEWCTAAYNSNYGTRTQRISEKNLVRGAKRSINQYSKDGVFIREWKSLTDAANTLGLRISKISSCCHNRNKSSGGYIWKFTDESKEHFNICL